MMKLKKKLILKKKPKKLLKLNWVKSSKLMT